MAESNLQFLTRVTGRISRALCWGLLAWASTCVPIFAQNVSPTDLDVLRWRSLGPSATGGRIVDIEVDPQNKATIYAAAATGGLWKTTNNGTTWTCIFENEGTISIGDIAIDPTDPAVIWVGTGEANNQRSSMWGDGVYKSTDSGKTWRNMGLGDTHHIGRIVIHPQQPQTVYVAALGHLYSENQQRGLFKTTDGGATWKKVLYVNPAVGVVDVVLHPENPKIVYAASYERLRRAWNFDGAGPGSAIYKSTNAGKKWKKLTGGLPTGEIGRIGLAIYPPDPNIVYATVSNQNVYRDDKPKADRLEREAHVMEMIAEGEVDVEAGEAELLRIAREAQEPEDDQTQKPPAPDAEKNSNAGGRMTSLGMRIAFQEGVAVVTEVQRRSAAQLAGIRKDDRLVSLLEVEIKNDDALEAVENRIRPGDRLTLIMRRGEQEQKRQLTMPRQRPQQIGGEVYRTEDAGKTWIKMNTESVGGRPPYYYGQIRVDPLDDQRLYLLSVPLYTSNDAGKTWESDAGRSVHVDQHALWIDPADPSHILLGNDGGFHVSHDRAKTWDFVFNLPLPQFYAIGVDRQRPYHVYGGLQDNGTYAGPSRSRSRSGVGRFDWHKIGGGDGFYVQVDPQDANIVFLESQFGVLYRLNRATGERKLVRPPQSDPAGNRDRYNWNSPILMSQHDSRVIYFGGNKLFKSFNRGDDWLTISPDLSTQNIERIAGNVPHCTITTIAESPLDKRRLLVGTDDGNVQWTDNAGETWTNMANRFPLKPANWWCSRVELSRHHRDRAYVSFTGYREDDFRPFVFATDDAGATWRSIINNLPDEPINVVKEDPTNANVLYVGTDFGVWVSLDKGAHWMPINSELPRAPVHDLLVHPREPDLVIGTHGRGIFVLDISAVQQMTAKIADKKAHLFQVADTTAWRSVSTQSISGDRSLLAANPPTGAVIHYWLKDKTEPKDLSLQVLDANDRRVRVLKPTGKRGVNRIVWDLRRDGGGRSRAAPGRYLAVLKIGDDEQRQEIVVQADPLGNR